MIAEKAPRRCGVRRSARLGTGAGRWKWTDFHDLYQAMLDSETVANVLIGNHGSSQVAHDLMYVDQDLPGILRVKGNRLDVWIDLVPLLRPVGADFFRPTDETAFERLRPGHVDSHEGEGGIDVTRVEGRVRCA